jgi:hypothetical protein
MSSQKWTISLVKQGKFKRGVVPADGQGRLLLLFVIMEGGSLAMAAGANPTIFGLFDRPTSINAFSF